MITVSYDTGACKDVVVVTQEEEVTFVPQLDQNKHTHAHTHTNTHTNTHTLLCYVVQGQWSGVISLEAATQEVTGWTVALEFSSNVQWIETVMAEVEFYTHHYN